MERIVLVITFGYAVWRFWACYHRIMTVWHWRLRRVIHTLQIHSRIRMLELVSYISLRSPLLSIFTLSTLFHLGSLEQRRISGGLLKT